jgi:hypothetical protein
MKKYLPFLLVIVLVAGAAFKEKVDIEKEKEAIKAVLQEEKAGFFNQDLKMMNDTWVQDPYSCKFNLGAKGFTGNLGFDEISKRSQKEVEDTSWDRKLVTATYSNYQFNISKTSAWVVCNLHWQGTYKGEALTLDQTRINVLAKVDGKWKLNLMAMQTVNPDKK